MTGNSGGAANALRCPPLSGGSVVEPHVVAASLHAAQVDSQFLELDQKITFVLPDPTSEKWNDLHSVPTLVHPAYQGVTEPNGLALLGQAKKVSQGRGLVWRDVPINVLPVAREAPDGKSALGFNDTEAL